MSVGHGWGAQKPTLGARINWSHPLAQGLEFCVLFNEEGGAAPLESRGGQGGTFTNTPTWSATGVDFAGTAYVSWAGLPDAPYTGALTAIWRGTIRTGSAYRAFVHKCDTNGGADNPFDFRSDNAASPLLAFVRASTGANNFREFLGPASVVGEPRQYAVTTTSGDITTTPTFYVGATATAGTLGTVGGGGGTGNATGVTYPLVIGRRLDGGTQMDGVATSVLIYSRALGAGEIARLAVEPYAFIQPPMSRWLRAGRTA